MWLRVVELMNDAFTTVSTHASGKDCFVEEVEIDHSLSQSVPPGLFLQILFRILVQYAFHLVVQRLQLPSNAADFVLNAVQLCIFLLFLVLSALGGMIERGAICPSGILFTLLKDAAQLWRAETSYYGLIHIIHSNSASFFGLRLLALQDLTLLFHPVLLTQLLGQLHLRLLQFLSFFGQGVVVGGEREDGGLVWLKSCSILLFVVI